jgi:hypothetical protein
VSGGVVDAVPAAGDAASTAARPEPAEVAPPDREATKPPSQVEVAGQAPPPSPVPGKALASDVGNAPQNAENAAQARAMAQRAAIADGQRNLLRMVEQIKVDGQRSVRTIMNTGSGSERIQGFLKNYAVVSERQLEDGRIEVILELPLTGPRGLSRFLVD